MPQLRKRTIILIISALVIVAVMVVVVIGIQARRNPSMKQTIRITLSQTGLDSLVMPILQKAGLVEPPWDERFVSTPNLSPNWVSSRRFLVTDLHRVLSEKDFRQAAQINSILSQEAFLRSYDALKAWETLRDSETLLVPKSTNPGLNYWDPEDVAADLFPFLLLASQYLDPKNESLWLETLANEREICGPMPCSIRLGSGEVIAEEQSRVVFSASEYAKDGLLAVTERAGRGPWFDRMEEAMDEIIDTASVQTEAGLIPDQGTEANGELLQVFTRLYWATGNERYLDMAERIAEAYLFDVFPKNNYLPTTYWDFETGEPLTSDVRLRDHGAEVIPGLTELYLLETLHQRPQADKYRQPLKQFLDNILSLPRTEDGLWYNSINTKTGQVLDPREVDTWGYILLGYQTFDLAEGTNIYSAEIERVMKAASTRSAFAWEGHFLDGYADTIESMLYLVKLYPDPEFHFWIDEQIEVMFAKQSNSGFIEEWYLDGNFIRTSLLYGLYKTQGVTFHPWKQDTRLGAAFDPDNASLYLHIATASNWDGIVKFDPPRYETIWNLPFEYPRLNGSPQWFIADPDQVYVVTNLNTGDEVTHTGQQLADGIPLSLGETNSTVQLLVKQLK
jgi:hypothetical protein